jgi:glycerol uptake facilitator-like aquaporin
VRGQLNVRQEGKSMKKGFAFKAWVYLLCVSFLLLASGFHTMVAEAREIGRPWVRWFQGEVKFESRKAVWKMWSSPILIFPGMRIKTEKGVS